MILTIIVGETGSGKTHETKKRIAPYPNLAVYDVQNEYELRPFSAKDNNKRFQLPSNVYGIKDFVTFTKKLKGYAFVIEEATGIFKGTIGKEFVQAVLAKRHTQNRYFLVFHALHRVPMDLFDFCDYLILFKTNDMEKNIKPKFPWIMDDFKELQIAPKYSKKIYRISNLAKENKM